MTALADTLFDLVNGPGLELAPAALALARIEYPHVDTAHYLGVIATLANEVSTRIAQDPGHDAPLEARVERLTRYLHGELGFTGNSERYEDPRNSCLNQVLDRRTGLPITLSLVYLEVARRSGLSGEGIGFPGHFLIRLADSDGSGRSVIVDPFGDGRVLDEADCRVLLERQAGVGAVLRPEMLAAATRHDIVVRMLSNLKRLYVQMRSFPQARLVTDLLVRLTPTALSELRDRGLLSYHLDDFNGALRDLEEYLRQSRLVAPDEGHKAEADQTWEHVKALRRRIAGFN